MGQGTKHAAGSMILGSPDNTLKVCDNEKNPFAPTEFLERFSNEENNNLSTYKKFQEI